MAPSIIYAGETPYTFYRASFPWGTTPAYRSADGRFRFLESEDSHPGAVLTPQQLAGILTMYYQPPAIRAGDYAELAALPS